MELFIFIIFLLLLPIFIFFIFPRNSSSDPGYKSYPIVRSLPGLVNNRHRALDWTVENLSRCPTQTSVFRRPGNQQIVVTANPANVKYMLKTKFEYFPKGERFISFLEDFLGRGIFNSDGEMWWKQRKTARMCLGKEMAYIQMKSIVAAVLERFVVEVPGKEDRPEILFCDT